MPKITNGYGHEITDMQWLAEHLHEFKTFDEAAPMICDNWERFHIHKEIKYKRVYLNEILIIEDEKLYTRFSDNKKMFISVEEIERLKEDVAQRPKRKFKRLCEWCKRAEHFCLAKPCPDRERNSPEHVQSVETVSEFFGRYLKKQQSKSKKFREYDSQGETKRFSNSR